MHTSSAIHFLIALLKASALTELTLFVSEISSKPLKNVLPIKYFFQK